MPKRPRDLGIAVLLALLGGCTFDPGPPKFTGHLSEHLIGEGADGPIINPELAGVVNKIEAGRPVTFGLVWRFDWILGHKLPGER